MKNSPATNPREDRAHVQKIFDADLSAVKRGVEDVVKAQNWNISAEEIARISRQILRKDLWVYDLDNAEDLEGTIFDMSSISGPIQITAKGEILSIRRRDEKDLRNYSLSRETVTINNKPTSVLKVVSIAFKIDKKIQKIRTDATSKLEGL